MATKPTVAVAMSGGVDSSVAAALLVEQGYTVIGLMLRLWSEQAPDRSNRCCTPDSIALARQVAAILSIPFYVIDAKQLFYDAVVQPFIYDYTHNLTPNPCIACNRLVRWRFLLDYALSAGADFLATGHYARLTTDQGQPIRLLRAVDSLKDQSYVLHTLKPAQIAHAKFPLGGYHKLEVRNLAQHYHLPVAERPDSQDLCFVGGSGDYRSFLTRYAPQALVPGPIVDQNGKTLGQHPGLAFYTIGQRKGLGISVPAPLYVLRKDLALNMLIVGERHLANPGRLIATQVNWISGFAPDSPFFAQVKIRYRSHDLPATVTVIHPDQVEVKFEKPVPDITPGQAAVIYNADVCLGGGTIVDLTE
jgi:tRNA-specific 2-thiouridylase